MNSQSRQKKKKKKVIGAGTGKYYNGSSGAKRVPESFVGEEALELGS